MKTYKLGEVIENFDSLRVPLSENQRKQRQGEYRYFGAQGVIDYVDGYIFDGEYILVAEDGNNLISGNKPLCILVDGKFWANNHVHIIRANEKAYTKYLYYLLNNINIKRYVTGSAQPKLNQRNLNRIKIKLPEVDIQIDVAEKIYIFDEKISHNLNLISKLEEYAQLLFHKWFVDFNFPDEEGKPYKDNGGEMYEVDGKIIPVGWELIPINKIIKKKTETTNPQEEPNKVFKYYSIPVFDDTKTYANELGSTISSNKYKVSSNNLLVSKLNPWFKRVIYPLDIDDVICSTEFVVWEPLKENHLEYLYILANTTKFIRYCIKASTGTSNSHKRVNPDFMLKFKIPYNEQIVIRFNEIVKPIIQKSHLMISENQLLEETRDLLIKKLIK